MNTYGLHSINRETFNLKWHASYSYPQEIRDILVTVLKVHNLTLNILGYIPLISLISGSTRILTGTLMCVVTLTVGKRHARQGVIIGHWYDEALLTGTTQISRGIFEAFIPFGWSVNGSLDSLATIFNVWKTLSAASTCTGTGCAGYENHEPYPDPDYPFPFWLLNLA